MLIWFIHAFLAYINRYMGWWSNHHWHRHWLVAWSVPSHYLNQCWNIVHWTLRNKLQWNFIWKFSYKKMNLKPLSRKCGPFCLYLNVLTVPWMSSLPLRTHSPYWNWIPCLQPGITQLRYSFHPERVTTSKCCQTGLTKFPYNPAQWSRLMRNLIPWL